MSQTKIRNESYSSSFSQNFKNSANNQDLLKTCQKINKLEILFSKQLINSDSNQKTNFNSKSTKNILIESNLNSKISEFQTNNFYNHRLNNQRDPFANLNHHSRTESLESRRMINLPKFLDKSVTAQNFFNTHNDKYKTYGGWSDFNYKTRNSESNKNESMNIIFKKKSQTKYSRMKSNITEINRYALLNNYDKCFMKKNYLGNNPVVGEIINRTENSKSQEKIVEENKNYEDYDSLSAQKRNSNINLDNKFDLNPKSNMTPIINKKSGNVGRSFSKIKFKIIKDLEEQNQKIIGQEEYYKKIQELANRTNFISQDKTDMRLFVNRKSTFLKRSDIDYIIKINREVDKNEADPGLTDLSLFNLKKKSRKSTKSLENKDENSFNFNPIGKNLKNSDFDINKNKLSSNRRRKTDITHLKEYNIEGISINRNKSSYNRQPGTNSYRNSMFVSNKNDNKKIESIPNANITDMFVVKIDKESFHRPSKFKENSFRVEIPKSPSIRIQSTSDIKNNTDENQFKSSNLGNENENSVRKSVRHSFLKIDRNALALRKFSNKLSQTDSVTNKINNEKPLGLNSEGNFNNIIKVYEESKNINSSADNKKKETNDSLNKIIKTPVKSESKVESHYQDTLEQNIEMRNKLNMDNKMYHINISKDDTVATNSPSFNLTYSDKDLIIKIKIIKKFLKEENPKNFHSNKQNYTKIYVFQDGIPILNDLKFNGKYVNIPTKKYFMKYSSKNERRKKFQEFLEEATKELHSKNRFNHVFTINGNEVFDLMDLPEDEKCCYVSTNSNFRGIHILYKIDEKKLKINNMDAKLLDYKPFDWTKVKRSYYHLACSYSGNSINNFEGKEKSHFLMKKSLNNQSRINTIGIEPNKYFNEYGTMLSFPNSNDKKKKHSAEEFLKEQNFKADASNYDSTSKSFSDGHCDYKPEYEYLSESEDRKFKAFDRIKNHINLEDRFDLMLHFTKINLGNLTNQIKNKRIKYYPERTKHTTEDTEVSVLIDKFNDRRNIDRNSKYIRKARKRNKKAKKLNFSKNTAALLLRRLLEHLGLLRLDKDKNLHHYHIDKRKCNSTKFIKLNMKRVENIYFKIDHEVEKFLPDLIALNIPKILEEFPKLKRIDLYRFYIEYKTLLKISIALRNSIRTIKKGIDFDTFYRTVPNMKIYGKQIAKELFKTMNERKTNFLEWDEFLKGMIMLKSRKKEIEDDYVVNKKFPNCDFIQDK